MKFNYTLYNKMYGVNLLTVDSPLTDNDMSQLFQEWGRLGYLNEQIYIKSIADWISKRAAEKLEELAGLATANDDQILMISSGSVKAVDLYQAIENAQFNSIALHHFDGSIIQANVDEILDEIQGQVCSMQLLATAGEVISSSDEAVASAVSTFSAKVQSSIGSVPASCSAIFESIIDAMQNMKDGASSAINSLMELLIPDETKSTNELVFTKAVDATGINPVMGFFSGINLSEVVSGIGTVVGLITATIFPVFGLVLQGVSSVFGFASKALSKTCINPIDIKTQDGSCDLFDQTAIHVRTSNRPISLIGKTYALAVPGGVVFVRYSETGSDWYFKTEANTDPWMAPYSFITDSTFLSTPSYGWMHSTDSPFDQTAAYVKRSPFQCPEDAEGENNAYYLTQFSKMSMYMYLCLICDKITPSNVQGVDWRNGWDIHRWTADRYKFLLPKATGAAIPKPSVVSNKDFVDLTNQEGEDSSLDYNWTTIVTWLNTYLIEKYVNGQIDFYLPLIEICSVPVGRVLIVSDAENAAAFGKLLGGIALTGAAIGATVATVKLRKTLKLRAIDKYKAYNAVLNNPSASAQDILTASKRYNRAQKLAGTNLLTASDPAVLVSNSSKDILDALPAAADIGDQIQQLYQTMNEKFAEIIALIH